jgi:DNA adenine methylase
MGQLMSGTVRQFPSPLRYPGGKGKIANYIKLLYLQNDLLGSEYVEVYAGGASLALSLLYGEYASHVHINDLDRNGHAFWWAVLNETDDLCRRVSRSRPSRAEWTRQRAVQLASHPDPVDLAFSTFFLNRTNRSGILTGGMIGGRNQDGPWKLGARYNKPNLIQRIEKAARYASRTTLTKMDGARYIKKRLPLLTSPFAYLDPPYFAKGQDLYQNFYDPQDHAAIAELVRRLDCQWLVSYDAVPEIMRLYKGVPHRRYSLSYSAQDRYRGREVMFFAPSLSIPRVKSPACLDNSLVETALRSRVRAWA